MRKLRLAHILYSHEYGTYVTASDKINYFPALGYIFNN